MFGTMSTDHQHNIPFGCNSRELVMERRWNMKSNHTETAPNCPRCASSNTKFCYYNNYSLSQPRYFCKGCRRYWTKGGSLRSVPVGGGCRKSRKSKSARLAADQRQSLSYQMPSPGSTSSNTDDSHGTSAANIDLAAVFANFLNQDSSINNDAVEAGDDDQDHELVCVDTNNINVDQESSSSGVSYNSLEFPPTNRFDAENHHLGNMMLPYDHFVDGADHHMFPPLGLLDQDCDSLNLQAILGDEEIGGEEILPNFEWQSIMQFQDFGSSFSSENDLKNMASNNMVTDDHDHFESWSASYDLSPSDYHWNNYN